MKKISTLLMALMLSSAFVSFGQTNGKQNNLPAVSIPKSLNLNGIPLTSFIPVGPELPLMPGQLRPDRCGFVTQMNKAIGQGYDKAAFEAIIQQKIQQIKADRAAGRTVEVVNYIIPVVFHVIHGGTAEGVGENTVASQIYQQIDQLNKDFGNQSGSPFLVAANTGLSFCPVLIDPNGNTLAQPGIDRISWAAKGWTNPTTFGSSNAQVNAMIDYIDATIKPNSIWDPAKYVNIWMYNFSNSGLLGYATFPTAGLSDLPAGETATTAGVVFLNGAIGSVASPGTAGNYGLGRTVTHELGHFFGLYHTWGDVTDCSGTDYCADTPPCSDTYFSTVPGCTVPVQCSSQPRMIQDYMDYSDDGCMNTYTQNQSDRIQAIMTGAPRRPSNPNSTLCTPPVANAISFTSAGPTVAETGTGSTCPKFKDYSVTVKPAIAASANATVNFNIGGTAILNNDYTILGSTSASYVNGESAAKGFTIRVTDDGAVEPTETITVSYTITGTGLVPATVNQNYSMSITNDDTLNYINNTTPVTTLYTEDFGTAANAGALPTGWQNGQFLATPGVNTWTANPVYGAATGFTAANGRVLHVTNVALSETAAATYTATSTSDAIAITPAINTTGLRNIKVNFDYASNGETDPGNPYDFGLLRYSTTSQTGPFTAVTDATGALVLLQGVTAKTNITLTLPAGADNAANLWIGFEWINDNSVRNLPPMIVDNIIVTGAASAVETAVSQSSNQTQNSAQTVQYMSASKKIIAAITNINANAGCINAAITSAGTGLQPLTTNAGAYLRSDKVIQITPSTANTTASYQATFYYTTAELAAWTTNVPNLKILKVADGVSLTSTLTPANSTLLTPVVDDQRSAKGYVAYTVNVTNGFSQFLLVSSATLLPVSSLDFAANARQRAIVLNWSTSSEINNKGFALERSTDAVHYDEITWISGAINSNRRIDYAYTDHFVQPNVLYYYRLRQTDIDNHFVLSDIRQAKIKGSDISISLSPNPAKDLVKLFVAGSGSMADITLYNAQGQLVRNWNKMNVSGVTTLDISGLAKGMYIFNVQVAGQTKVEKLIIQ